MNAETAAHPSNHDDTRTDWSAELKLGVVLSIFATLAAVALGSHISESVIILGVIVLATVASWYQMERPVLEPALTRTHRR